MIWGTTTVYIIVRLKVYYNRLSSPSFSKISILRQLLSLLLRIRLLLPGLDITELHTSPGIDVHHVLLVAMRHDLDVLRYRERVIELARRSGVTMLDVFYGSQLPSLDYG